MPKRTMEIERVRSTSIRLDEWRRSQELVGIAHRIFNSQDFQLMLDCLKTENPINFGYASGQGVTSDDRVAHACEAEGYAKCLNNLEAMCSLATAQPEIEAVFAPEPIPPEVLAANAIAPPTEKELIAKFPKPIRKRTRD